MKLYVVFFFSYLFSTIFIDSSQKKDDSIMIDNVGD